jgi:hypothetical protein
MIIRFFKAMGASTYAHPTWNFRNSMGRIPEGGFTKRNSSSYTTKLLPKINSSSPPFTWKEEL